MLGQTYRTVCTVGQLFPRMSTLLMFPVIVTWSLVLHLSPWLLCQFTKTLLPKRCAVKEGSTDIKVAGTRWIISIYWFHEEQSRACCTANTHTDQLFECSLLLPPVVTDQIDEKCCERGGWRLAWHHCRFSWIDPHGTAGIMKKKWRWCWNNLLFGRKLCSRHVSNLFIECGQVGVLQCIQKGAFFLK